MHLADRCYEFPFITPVGVRSIVISVSACLCLSAPMSKTARPNFNRILYMLPVAVARSCSDGNATNTVFPVLWMTSCFHILERLGKIRINNAHVSSSSPGGGTGGNVCRLRRHLVSQLHVKYGIKYRCIRSL